MCNAGTADVPRVTATAIASHSRRIGHCRIGGIIVFFTLKRLYGNKQLTKAGLARAVGKNWITAAEYQTITGEAYKDGN